MTGVKYFKTKHQKRGFSLIEIVVAVSMFTLVIVIITNVFKNVIEGQRSAVAAQNTQESMRYILEAISKEVRTARRLSTVTECRSTLGLATTPADATNKVLNTAGSNNILYFKNKNGACVVYYLANGQLVIIRDTDRDGDVGASEVNDYMASSTPDEILVSNLSFSVTDDLFDAFHSLQPYVTIRMDVENKTSKQMHKQKMTIQTTVSSRYYE